MGLVRVLALEGVVDLLEIGLFALALVLMVKGLDAGLLAWLGGFLSDLLGFRRLGLELGTGDFEDFPL